MRPGDVLTVATGDVLTLEGAVRVLRVIKLATRRGPATEARLLYDELA